MGIRYLKIISSVFLILIGATTSSCHSQANTANKAELKSLSKDSQIAEYVVEVFEDSKGNLWFGTINKGAARYDGKTLIYFTTANGLIGNTVTSFAEDKIGNIWFGTHSGLSKYDGKTFSNFNTSNGLVNDVVSELLIDKKGKLWIGTWGGVSRFDGATFSLFTVPNPDVELLPYQSTTNWVTEIIEDKQGNIWISRDGYGACKYDGRLFTHYTKQNGLASNNVQAIREDKQGNLWFGSRVAEKDNPDPGGRTGDGGLSRFDGKTITQFTTLKGLSKNDIYAIGLDNNGNIWIGANGLGAYRYDGKNFTLLSKTDRPDLIHEVYGYGIQSILSDKKGTIWLGLSGGLFRIEGDSIKNVSINGPWD